MNKLPKITRIARDQHYPDNVELDLVWENDYKTMLTFHTSDFDNNGLNARRIIEAHVGMVKRHIDADLTVARLKEYLEELKQKIELDKAESKCQQEQSRSTS